MKKILIGAIFGILLIPQGSGQITANNTGKATAGCFANSGSMKLSNVTITCNGIPRRDMGKLLKMLNELLRDQDTVGSKLDSIQVQLDRINEAVASGSFGNLRERALAFSREIADFLKENDANDPSKRYQNQEEREKLHAEWDSDTDKEFASTYWHEVKSMQKEFASHGYRDDRLDEIIRSGDEAVAINREEQQQVERGAVPSGYANRAMVVIWPQIDEIGKAFKRLALQLPQTQPTP